MQDNIITWNLANWVSVVLMALLGFFALGAIMSWYRQKVGAVGNTTTADKYS